MGTGKSKICKCGKKLRPRNKSGLCRKCGPRPLRTLDEILSGKYPNCNSNHLKKKLISEGVKENKCEKCGISDWCGEELTLQLHHKNGNSKDHILENLLILCPNCHTQTDTWGNKKNLMA